MISYELVQVYFLGGAASERKTSGVGIPIKRKGEEKGRR